MDDEKYSLSEFNNMNEGWWNSIYADSSHDALPLSKIRSSLGKAQVDWDLIYELMANETIIECEVLADNQGGLLVSNDSVTGFVPISHLKEFHKIFKSKKKDPVLKAYIGKTLRLKVIECAQNRGRIVLSERAALAKPGTRNELINNLKEGDRVSGNVTNITSFGAFIDLGGLEGLVHISELSWGRVNDPKDFIQLGQQVNAVVLEVQKKENKVSLSIKRLEKNPWDTIEETFPIGTITQGKITNIVDYGAFVSLKDGLEGLIHATEMALTEDLMPKDVVKVGQTVDIELVRIDPLRKRMSFRLIS